MARIVGEKQYNSFVKGVITEASPLTFPENSTRDEANFILKRDGSRERRLGMDYELGYTLTNSTQTELTVPQTEIQFHQWDNAGGSKTIGIVRVRSLLYFYDLNTANPSGNLLNGGNSVNVYYTIVGGDGLLNSSAEFININNSVVIVSKDFPRLALLTYNPDTDTVTLDHFRLKVRDFWGVYETLSLTERSSTLSTAHKYNLYNQGWTPTIYTTCGTNPIDCTKSILGVYPSNADIWTYGKIGNSASADYQKYSPTEMAKNSQDNSAAPNGKYIIDALQRGYYREAASGISGVPVDMEQGCISTATVFSGRVFYSGIASKVAGGDKLSPNYSGYIFFSKTIYSNEDLGKCYQEADPTSENISDIVATDGGVIHIPEASQILKLVATKTSVLAFATNGVWEIYSDNGFTATGYGINKITDIGLTGSKTVVVADGFVLYWGNGGIYLLQSDQVNGRYVPSNVSLTTIQSWYNDLPEATKSNARGFYDERESVVRWLYNDAADYDGVTFKNKYTKELVFDVALQAFYFVTLSQVTNGPFVADYVSLPNYVDRDVVEDVYVGTDPVTVGGVQVTVTSQAQEPRGVSLKFLTAVKKLVGPTEYYHVTMSEYNNPTFKDWVTFNGVGANYTSYMVTGQEVFGDLMRTKQVPYILFFFKRTEDGFDNDLNIEHPSSCLVQARWNWTDSANSGKWSSQFQAYRLKRNYIPSDASDTFDYGEEVIITKNKLRGSGKSLSLRIESEPGKDMKLLGWALTLSGNSQP